MKKTELYTQGPLKAEKITKSYDIVNNGILKINSDLINLYKGLFESSSNPDLSNFYDNNTYGTIEFTSILDETNEIFSVEPIFFNKIYSFHNSIRINSNVFVFDTIYLKSSNVYIDSFNIDLFCFDTINRFGGRLNLSHLVDSVYSKNSKGKVRLFYRLGDENKASNDIGSLGFGVKSNLPDMDILIERSNSVNAVTSNENFYSYKLTPEFERKNIDLSFYPYLNDSNDIAMWAYNQNQKPESSILKMDSSFYVAKSNLKSARYTVADANCPVSERPEFYLIDSINYCLNEKEDLILSPEISGEYYYRWSYKNLSTSDSTKKSIVLPYNKLKFFKDKTVKVTLGVWDKRGCHSFDTVSINILSPPNVSIISKTSQGLLKSSFCKFDNVVLEDTIEKSGKGRYFFYYGDSREYASTNPLYSTWYNNNGYFRPYIIYRDENLCKDTAFKDIVVYDNPSVNFDFPDTLCTNKKVLLNTDVWIQKTSSGEHCRNYSWWINDKLVKTILADTTGNFDMKYSFEDAAPYNIKLKVETNTGCENSSEKTALVNKTPEVTVATYPENELCVNDTFGFIVPDHNYFYLSRFNKKSFEFVDSLANKYRALTDGADTINHIFYSGKGCESIVAKEIVTNPLPEPDFSFYVNGKKAGIACSDDKIEVRNSNIIDSGWFYFNGNVIKQFRGDYYFNHSPENGINKFTLKASNEFGCRNQITYYLDVKKAPEPFYKPLNLCYNTDSVFADSVFNDSDSSLWQYGDGLYGTEPAHVYQKPGLYFPALICENYYEDSLVCSALFYDTVEVFPEVTSEIEMSDSSFCIGDSVLAFVGMNSSGGADLSYLWRNSSKSVFREEAYYNNVAENKGRDSLFLKTLNNQNSCYSIDTAFFNVYKAPSYSIEKDGNCMFDSIKYKANLTDDIIKRFSWYFDDGTYKNGRDICYQRNKKPYVSIETELITVHNCIKRDSFSFSLDTLPAEIVNNNIRTCGDSLKVKGNPAYSLRWKSGDTNWYKWFHTSKSSFVEVTDKNTLCKTIDSFNVEINSEPLVKILFDEPLCDSALLYTNMPDYYHFKWSGDVSEPDLKVSKSGCYNVKVIDDNGCTGSDTVNVEVNRTIRQNIISASEVICPGEKAVFNIKSCPFEKLVMNGTLYKDSFSVDSSGYYSFVFTDTNKCTSVFNSNFEFAEYPVSNNLDTFICMPGSLNLKAGYASGYLWGNGAKSNSVEITQGGTYSSVLNYKGCYDTSVFYVKEKKVPEIEIDNQINSCKGDTARICLSGNQANSYLWSDGTNKPCLFKTEPGFFSLTVTSSAGCQNIKPEINLNFYEKPDFIIPDSIELCGSSIIEAEADVENYLWNDSITDKQIYAGESGNYKLKIFNSLNCASEKSININVKQIIHPGLPSDTILCPGNFLSLDIDTNSLISGFQWGDNYNFVSRTFKSEGIFSLAFFHNNGCVTRDKFRLQFYEVAYKNDLQDRYLCSGDSIEIVQEDILNYKLIKGGKQKDASGNIIIDEEGDYMLMALDSNNCEYHDSFALKRSYNDISPRFLCASDILAGDTVRFVDLSYPLPSKWLWDFDDGVKSKLQDPMHTFFTTDTFNVSLFVTNGFCAATITKPVAVDKYLKNYFINEQGKSESNKNEGFKNVKVYPNPFRNYIKTEINTYSGGKVRIVIFSLEGKVVFIKDLDTSGFLFLKIDADNLKRGLYIMRISFNDYYKIFKVIK